MQLELDRSIKVTKHARDRIAESQLTVEEAIAMIWKSESEKSLNKKDKKYKREKYGAEQERVSYWRNGPCIFTLMEKLDDITKEPIYLLITMTNQEITMRW